MNRRQFIQQAAAAVAVTNLIPSTRAEDKADMIPIVDTHQHLWDLKKFTLPWLKEAAHLDKTFVMSDYLKATEGLNVVETVYMEVDVAPEQQRAEADYVLNLCRTPGNPMVAAVIGGHPASPGFAKYATSFKDVKEVKGLRQVIHGGGTPAGYCLGKDFLKGVQLLGDLGKTFDICIRPDELADAAKLIEACPGTRFILDHCGNGDVRSKNLNLTKWKKGMAEVATKKNVVCKVSGIVVNAEPDKWKPEDLAPIINYTLDTFGPDRVLFGGDWPVCTKASTFKQWVDALKMIVKDRKPEDQLKLFHDNAVKFYGLPAKK